MSKLIRKFGKETQFFLNDGSIASGAQFFQYSAGTTTKVDTYTDVAGGTANSNPMVLDSAGRLAQDVFIDQSMKFVLAPSTDTDPPASPIWTIDNITAVDQLWLTTAKSADYTTLTTDNYKLITVDASTGNKTVSLLDAATAGVGYIQAVKKIDNSSNTVTVDPNGSQTIDATHTTQVLNTQNQGIFYASDGSNWQVIAMTFGEGIVMGASVFTFGRSITISSGDLTLTTGNIILSDTEADIQGQVRLTKTDTRTDTVARPLTIDAPTSGTPAAGIGTGILFDAESADEAPSNFGAIEFAATDVTAGSEDTYFDILTRVAGAALTKVWRLIATGAFKGIFTHANTADRTYTLPDTNISQFIVQIVNTQTGAVATGTTTIPFDDSIPQITEGDQYMTLAITPKSASNILYIDVAVMLANSATTNVNVTAALFQDSTANALAAANAVTQVALAGDSGSALFFKHKMTAGTTSSTTFRVRAGSNNAGTTTFNGLGGSREFGGVLASSITITEVSP